MLQYPDLSFVTLMYFTFAFLSVFCFCFLYVNYSYGTEDVNKLEELIKKTQTNKQTNKQKTIIKPDVVKHKKEVNTIVRTSTSEGSNHTV